LREDEEEHTTAHLAARPEQRAEATLAEAHSGARL